MGKEEGLAAMMDSFVMPFRGLCDVVFDGG